MPITASVSFYPDWLLECIPNLFSSAKRFSCLPPCFLPWKERSGSERKLRNESHHRKEGRRRMTWEEETTTNDSMEIESIGNQILRWFTWHEKTVRNRASDIRPMHKCLSNWLYIITVHHSSRLGNLVTRREFAIKKHRSPRIASRFFILWGCLIFSKDIWSIIQQLPASRKDLFANTCMRRLLCSVNDIELCSLVVNLCKLAVTARRHEKRSQAMDGFLIVCFKDPEQSTSYPNFSEKMSPWLFRSGFKWCVRTSQVPYYFLVMGSGSSSDVKPFRGNSERFESRTSNWSSFESEADQHFQQSFRNKFGGEKFDLSEEAGDPFEEGGNVKEIDHSNIRPHQTAEKIAAANRYPAGQRQDSERNPFEIETEAGHPLSITHSDPFRSSLPKKEEGENQKETTWTEPNSYAAQGMAWNHRQFLSSDVAGLSNATKKKISRSRLSYEDSCDEGAEGECMKSDPKILTSQALSEIDHLLSSEAEKRDQTEAFLVNLNRKRGQSVANAVEPRHVSLISLFYRLSLSLSLSLPSGLLECCCKWLREGIGLWLSRFSWKWLLQQSRAYSTSPCLSLAGEMSVDDLYSAFSSSSNHQHNQVKSNRKPYVLEHTSVTHVSCLLTAWLQSLHWHER